MSYSAPAFVRPHVESLSPLSEEALGGRATRNYIPTSSVGITWVANLALFIPFGVSQPFLVREAWWQTSTGVTANVDVGVYSTTGTRLWSTGSTAHGGAGASIIVNTSSVTDALLPVGDYFMAFALDSATASLMGGWATTANIGASLGVGQMTTAFPLPDPATIVPATNGLLPYFGLTGYTVGA